MPPNPAQALRGEHLRPLNPWCVSPPCRRDAVCAGSADLRRPPTPAPAPAPALTQTKTKPTQPNPTRPDIAVAHVAHVEALVLLHIVKRGPAPLAGALLPLVGVRADPRERGGGPAGGEPPAHPARGLVRPPAVRSHHARCAYVQPQVRRRSGLAHPSPARSQAVGGAADTWRCERTAHMRAWTSQRMCLWGGGETTVAQY